MKKSDHECLEHRVSYRLGMRSKRMQSMPHRKQSKLMHKAIGWGRRRERSTETQCSFRDSVGRNFTHLGEIQPGRDRDDRGVYPVLAWKGTRQNRKYPGWLIDGFSDDNFHFPVYRTHAQVIITS